MIIADPSPSDFRMFFAPASFAAQSHSVDIITRFQVLVYGPVNADGAVRFIINDGARAAYFALAVQGQRGVGIANGTSYADPANYPVFVPVDWAGLTELHLRRHANGDAEIVSVNGFAPASQALFPAGSMPPGTRPTPTVEFGAASPEAQAKVNFMEFRAFETPVAAIPEPETYALLIAGLGVLGLAMRRRKAKPADSPVQ